jgi:hypothetical protein
LGWIFEISYLRQGGWLQNIDSRDFVCKFFGMNNLPDLGRDGKGKAKTKGCPARIACGSL